MKLPNYEYAVVPEAKIVRYLLDLSHPVGRSKAIFFLRFGFTLDKWEIMAQAFIAHISDHDLTGVEITEDGQRYIVDGILHTPDGRNPFVRSIWFLETGTAVPRFVTSYPVKKRAT